MAIELADPLHPVRREDTHPLAPLAGTRSQAAQRLQIGLVGLASMILLVGLANIILTNARENQARVVPEAAATVAAEDGSTETSDPLADAGVVPDLPDEPTGEAASAGAAQRP